MDAFPLFAIFARDSYDVICSFSYRAGWIFPGDDPDEVAEPLPPPPTTMPKVDPQSAEPTAEPKVDTSNDPLATMMAPPSRAPSAMKRPAVGPKTTAGRYPPGMMTPGGPGGMPSPAVSGTAAPPQFAVFTPKPATVEKEED